MAPKTVAVIGALFAELVMISSRTPARGETLLAEEYFEGSGGKGANTAIAMYRTSHKKPAKSHELATLNLTTTQDDIEINVKMVGAVADDKYGKDLQAALSENGVDCSDMVVLKAPEQRTGIAFVMVDHVTRDNRILIHRGASGTWKKEHFVNASDLGRGITPDLCVAQMEIQVEVVQQMIETAGLAGIDFVLNAAPAGTLEYETYKWITHLLVNETEAAILSGRDADEINEKSWDSVCEEFLNRGVKNVVITLGEKGAYFANAKKRGRCPGYKVDVIDATGAGDTFTAAYSSEYLRQISTGDKEWDIERAVIRANKAAAMTVTKLGSQAGIPWSDETDVFDAPVWEADISSLNVTEEPSGNPADKQ